MNKKVTAISIVIALLIISNMKLSKTNDIYEAYLDQEINSNMTSIKKNLHFTKNKLEEILASEELSYKDAYTIQDCYRNCAVYNQEIRHIYRSIIPKEHYSIENFDMLLLRNYADLLENNFTSELRKMPEEKVELSDRELKQMSILLNYTKKYHDVSERFAYGRLHLASGNIKKLYDELIETGITINLKDFFLIGPNTEEIIVTYQPKHKSISITDKSKIAEFVRLIEHCSIYDRPRMVDQVGHIYSFTIVNKGNKTGHVVIYDTEVVIGDKEYDVVEGGLSLKDFNLLFQEELDL